MEDNDIDQKLFDLDVSDTDEEPSVEIKMKKCRQLDQCKITDFFTAKLKVKDMLGTKDVVTE